MSYTPVTDHEARILARVLDQFEDAAKLQDFIIAFAIELQEAEDALGDYANLSTVSTATGSLLDVIGDFVGEAREGRNDTNYRAGIMSQVRLNRGGGEPETMIAALIEYADAVYLVEHFPAGVSAGLVNPTQVNRALRAARKTKPAAVQLYGVMDIPAPPVAPFVLVSLLGSSWPIGAGLDDLASPGDGGLLVSLLP